MQDFLRLVAQRRPQCPHVAHRKQTLGEWTLQGKPHQWHEAEVVQVDAKPLTVYLDHGYGWLGAMYDGLVYLTPSDTLVVGDTAVVRNKECHAVTKYVWLQHKHN